MSASEAQVVDPEHRFARAYVHAGMVALDGEKMSKSKGNLELVSRLRSEGVNPMAIRWELLTHHYRSDWEWDNDLLAVSAEEYDEVRTAVAGGAGAPTVAVVAEVLAALADDLDAPRALEALGDWAEATHGGDVSEAGAGEVIRTLADAALGLAL